MVVTVHLHTVLQRETPEGRLRRLDAAVPAECTVADLVRHLAIRLDPDWTLFVVNGRQASLGQALREGDEIHLIPALAGGARAVGCPGETGGNIETAGRGRQEEGGSN